MKYTQITLKPGTPTPYTDPNRTIVRFYVEDRDAVNRVFQFAMNIGSWIVVQSLFSNQYCIDVESTTADVLEGYIAAIPDHPGPECKYLALWSRDDEASRLHVFRSPDDRARTTRSMVRQGEIETGDHLMFADIAGFECPAFYDVDIDSL